MACFTLPIRLRVNTLLLNNVPGATIVASAAIITVGATIFMGYAVLAAAPEATSRQASGENLPAIEWQESHRWTDAAGIRHADARLLAADQTRARLQRSDGKIVTTALETLSPADQEFIRAHVAAAGGSRRYSARVASISDHVAADSQSTKVTQWKSGVGDALRDVVDDLASATIGLASLSATTGSPPLGSEPGLLDRLAAPLPLNAVSVVPSSGYGSNTAQGVEPS